MYTNAKYIKPPFFPEPNGIEVDINGVTSFVPLDPTNTDYQQIMALVEDGELTIAPAEEPTE
jgi:hypothetical protein